MACSSISSGSKSTSAVDLQPRHRCRSRSCLPQGAALLDAEAEGAADGPTLGGAATPGCRRKKRRRRDSQRSARCPLSGRLQNRYRRWHKRKRSPAALRRRLRRRLPAPLPLPWRASAPVRLALSRLPAAVQPRPRSRTPPHCPCCGCVRQAQCWRWTSSRWPSERIRTSAPRRRTTRRWRTRCQTPCCCCSCWGDRSRCCCCRGAHAWSEDSQGDCS